MQLIRLLIAGVSLLAAPIEWLHVPIGIRQILSGGGLQESTYPAWQRERTEKLQERLAEGTAEHIAYFLLQSRSFTDEPSLDPVVEARAYFEALPAGRRKEFLNGQDAGMAFAAPVQRRIDAFWSVAPKEERHRLLRAMAGRLAWQRQRVMESAFRFLMLRAAEDHADSLYQRRGLSADPYPASMRAVERGLAKLPGPRHAVLLAGPGADLGSRFGVDDSRPVMSPQPKALLSLLRSRPPRFDCVDIRPEVVEALAGGPCRALILDLASERLPTDSYDLAVATNVLVYLPDEELALAIGNLAGALRPGGCLLHNDGRFGARLFGEAAGIPVVAFENLTLGQRGGREQVERIVIHCKPVALRD